MGEIISSNQIINEIIHYVNDRPLHKTLKDILIIQNLRECMGRAEFLLRKFIRKFLKKDHYQNKYLSHKFDKLSLDEIKEVLLFYTKDENFSLNCKKIDHHFIKITKSV